MKKDETKVEVTLTASPSAMEYWALQFLEHVEVTAPQALRERIKKALDEGREKYSN